jgi:hypothetical protein
VKFFALAAAFLATLPACAQETALQADFRKEGEAFKKDCGHFSIAGCAQLLFTAHPLHIAVGSLAPGNGFGAGLALTTHYTPNESWRMFFSGDGVATPNHSWRAGVDMTAVFIRHRAIQITTGTSTSNASRPPSLGVTEMPVFHFYAQGTSLNQLGFYGLGQGTPRNESAFGMTQTIVGANGVWPLWARLNLSLTGEVNGRLYSIRGSTIGNVPSLAATGNENIAPGLFGAPNFTQFSEGVRIRPHFLNGYVRLNYQAKFQEWIASRGGYSFRRLALDLGHEFPLYTTTRSLAPADFNGPNSCSSSPNDPGCPTFSRNLEGSVQLRFIYTRSYTSSGNVVPFFVDPTIGGSDINGTTLLPSYPDYRFRGPNMMVLRASFEHSIGKLPVGAKFLVDEGRVSVLGSDLDWDHLAHSYAAGITLHAGGLPVVELLFAWGGHEGTHKIANVSQSLLGGSPRPSLH